MSTQPPATVYDILQIPPGDKDNPAWVNEEFEAVVSGVRPGQGRKPTKAKLSDPHNPGVSIEACFFGGRNVASYNGKVCLFSGQGMKMGEYNGTPELTIGDKVTIQVLGGHAASTTTAPAGRAPAARGTVDDTRGGSHPDEPPPPAAPAPRAIEGQTVGMALKEANLAVLSAHEAEAAGPDYVPGSFLAYLKSPAYSKDIYHLASDIIRVSHLIQAGKLAPSAKDRADPDFEKKQAAAKEAARVAAEEAERKRKEAEEAEARRRAAQSAPAAQENLDEDVPF